MQDEILRETRETVIRIEVKLDEALTHLDDHEDRIRGLEGWRGRIPGGIIAAILAFFGVHSNT